ncbi:MAG TPA: beta-lactamase family protein [Firmicutes bacterium]|jgi:CubicO group peptidase (beta-lactamase class C family)|nr:beta-lactamase family protein [Bacillota bacterium]
MRFEHKAGVRRRLILSFVVTITVTLAIAGFNPFRRSVQPHAPLPEFTAHLDRRITSLMRLYNIPGCSMALVEDYQLVWLKAYGYADVEQKRPLTVDTPMSVQSISKAVTAWGVMHLVDHGELDLDAPIVEYLKTWQFPQSAFPTEKITSRQLLSHSAGLPLGDVFAIYAPEEQRPTLREMLTREAVLMAEPGQRFSYSNTGFNLLELLIEDITGEAFAAYMERVVLKPLGMENASFTWRADFDPAVPVGYNLKHQPVPVYVYAAKASGGLFATAKDIATFAIGEMAGEDAQVLSAAGMRAMYEDHSSNLGIYGLVFDFYGLGHYVEVLDHDTFAISHGGQGNGIMTHYHAVPNTGDAIVILTNSQRSWPFIAAVLSDWAHWRGFPPLGMGRILWGKIALWLLAAIICWVSLLLLLQAGRASRAANHLRRSVHLPLRQWIKVVIAVLIFCGLGWCISQKYLFLTAVFPRATNGLGVSLFILGVALLVSAFVQGKLFRSNPHQW